GDASGEGHHAGARREDVAAHRGRQVDATVAGAPLLRGRVERPEYAGGARQWELPAAGRGRGGRGRGVRGPEREEAHDEQDRRDEYGVRQGFWGGGHA